MYAGPIEQIYKDMEVKVEQQLEETIIKAIKECEIEVDRDELIKALQYDRNQYKKGYNDALNDISEDIKSFSKYYLETEKVLEIIDEYRSEEV